MNQQIIEDDFSVFIPFETIKGGEGTDKYQNMLFRGIASTTKHGEDADGETLEPEGMDLADLLREGNINYHHLWTDKPSTIIGEPVKAEIRNGELYLEGRLYPSSAKAREVFDLAEVLEKDSDTRRLGFSIEGKAVKRDPRNKNRITKSRIRNVAITPSPKCKGTRMEIMKGGLDNIDFELVKAMDDGNGGEFSPYLIDVTDNGVRRTVDKHLNIKIWPVEKAMDMAAVGKLAPEDVEHDVRKVKVPGDYLKKKTLTKGEICVELLSTFNLSDEQVLPMYYFIEDIQKALTPNMSKIEFTPDALQKAKELLNLVKANPNDATDPKPTGDGADTVQEKKLQKGDIDKMKAECDEMKNKAKEFADKAAELEKSISAAEVTMGTTNGTDATPAATQSLGKAETAELIKAANDELLKGLSEKFEGALATIISQKDAENAELKKALDETNAKLDEIGKTSNGPKSIITKGFQERFAPAKDGETTISLSVDKKRVVAELVKAAGKNFTEDNLFAKAASTVEIAGALGATPQEASAVAQKMRELHNIIITG